MNDLSAEDVGNILLLEHVNHSGSGSNTSDDSSSSG